MELFTKYKELIFFGLALISFNLNGTAQEKKLPINPLPILYTWDYDQLVEKMGTGEELVEKWNNQPYLAGYRYKMDWFNRPARAEFYFNEARILRLVISMDHLTDRSEYQSDHAAKTDATDILITNPEKMDSLKKLSLAMIEIGKENIRKDSMRCDSIINELNTCLGLPLFRDSAPPTEKNFLYYANWVSKGYSCGLRDYPDHLNITFTLAKPNTSTISEFSLPDSTVVIQRSYFTHNKDQLEIFLLGNRESSKSMLFSDIYLMVDFKGKGMMVEELPDIGGTGYEPSYQWIELTGDTYPELLITTKTGADATCRNYSIFSLSYGEPILLWNLGDEEISIPEELQTSIGTNSLDEICCDGIQFSEPNRNGAVNFVTRYPVHHPADSKTLGHIQIKWTYTTEFWEISDYSYEKVEK